MAWLPHSPMLAIDILPPHSGGLHLVVHAQPLLHLGLRRVILLQQFFFFYSPVQEILPLTNFVFLQSQPHVGKRNFNLCQLVPSPPLLHFPCFMYSILKRSPNKEKFLVPCNLLPKSFPKNPSNVFSWTSTCFGLPSCNRVVLQYIHKELVALRLQGGMKGMTLLH